MTYEEWMSTVPMEIKEDSLWRMEVLLTEVVALHRIRLQTQIIRLLLKIIPCERGYHLHEEPPEYNLAIDTDDLLHNVPIPP